MFCHELYPANGELAPALTGAPLLLLPGNMLLQFPSAAPPNAPIAPIAAVHGLFAAWATCVAPLMALLPAPVVIPPKDVGLSRPAVPLRALAAASQFCRPWA
jgi:hypothetical protein